MSEAKSKNHTIVKTFNGINVEKFLTIKFNSKNKSKAICNGIEVIME